jgi:hypothetical protein
MELRVWRPADTRTAILGKLAYHIRKWGKLAMASTYSKLVSLSAAALLVLFAPACSKSSDSKSNDQQKPDKTAASTSAATATQQTAPATSAAGKTEAVVFEVTGTGEALTIDLVPAGNPERLYNVPLPWTSTINIGPEVNQLQVVVVGTGETNPGCKITLDGKVVAEKPVGGDAHCVFDR